VAGIAREIGPTEVNGDASGDVLGLGWGSTEGAILQAVERARAKGKKVSSAHLRWLNPLPPDLGDVMKRFKTVLLPEMNLGQLALMLRATYLVDVKSLTKVQGKPWKVSELEAHILEHA
jgi:2-oxoglutarate ferredoxin oxidoreductase subunit alpha